MSEVKDILESLGYPLYPDSNGWRSPAIYRNGDNKTALKIFDDGTWIDFVENRKGKLPDLVAITLNLTSIQEAKQWLKDRDFTNEEVSEVSKNQIKTIKTFPDEVLNTFIPDYSYWLNRNISEDTVKLFKGGVCNE